MNALDAYNVSGRITRKQLSMPSAEIMDIRYWRIERNAVVSVYSAIAASWVTISI